MLALALITFLNILGIKKVKAFQTPILALTTALIVLVCIIQLFDSSIDFSIPIDGAFDVTKSDPSLVAEAAALVFVAYAGIYKAGAIGGEVKNPEKNLHYGMLISLLAITVFYVLVSIVMMASVEGEWWLNSDGEPREDPIFRILRCSRIYKSRNCACYISGLDDDFRCFIRITCSIEIFVRYGKGFSTT